MIYITIAERRPRSDQETGRCSPFGVPQIGQIDRPRKHGFLQVGRLQHRPRTQKTELGNDLVGSLRHQVRNKHIVRQTHTHVYVRTCLVFIDHRRGLLHIAEYVHHVVGPTVCVLLYLAFAKVVDLVLSGKNSLTYTCCCHDEFSLFNPFICQK